MNVTIRHAAASDLHALTDIYNHYIVHTPFTFDLVPKTMQQRAHWMQQFSAEGPHQLLVAVCEEAVIGYASSDSFRNKEAYQTSVETSVYLDHRQTRAGVGTPLYNALFESIGPNDIHRAYAGITQPNEASVALHTKAGFELLGIYQEVGRKFDQYWDVHWFEKRLN